MAEHVRVQKSLPRAESEAVRMAQGLADAIQQHRKTVLASPIALAVIFAILYAFCGPEFRRVIDFMAPGHLFGR